MGLRIGLRGERPTFKRIRHETRTEFKPVSSDANAFNSTIVRQDPREFGSMGPLFGSRSENEPEATLNAQELGSPRTNHMAAREWLSLAY
jgi:hypothetical protein